MIQRKKKEKKKESQKKGKSVVHRFVFAGERMKNK